MTDNLDELEARVAVLREAMQYAIGGLDRRDHLSAVLDTLDPAALRLLARLKTAESALAHFTPLESLGEGGKCTFVMGDETLALIEAWRRACATEGDGDADRT
jgi:hypothetical protein